MQPWREVIQKLKSHTPKANKGLLPISLVFDLLMAITAHRDNGQPLMTQRGFLDN
jgi:hypothetical protein